MSGGCPRRAERVTTSSGTPSAGSGGETTTSSGAPSAGGGSERVQSGSRGVQSGVRSWRGQRRGRDDGQRRAVTGYDRCGEDGSERAGTYDGRALRRASTGVGNDGGSAVVGLGDDMGSRGDECRIEGSSGVAAATATAGDCTNPAVVTSASPGSASNYPSGRGDAFV